MKHHLALIALFTLAVCCLGQGTARGQVKVVPPDDVRQNLYSHFPDATNLSWSEADAHYFAHFSQRGMNMEAKYTLTGKWVSTDIYNIPQSKLPPSLVNYLKGNHPNFKLREVFFHDEPQNSGRKSYYRIKLQQGGKTLFFHDNGNFWK